MTNMKIEAMAHPTDIELAGLLDASISDNDRERLEDHIGACDECLGKIVSAYDAVKSFRKKGSFAKGKAKFMKRINFYLLLAIISFLASFITPRYFIQLLVATLLLGIKWIVDSKSTKMLVMIYEAWKRGGEKEASKILSTLTPKSKNRF